jgi:multidrug efflux system outer membrane protein
MNTKQIISVIGLVLFLNGCTMMPKYTRPPSPVPVDFPTGEAYNDGQSTQGALPATDIKWRNVFPDEKLQTVIGMSLLNNRDLRLAALNVESARALYGVARTELFPVVSATGAGGKQRAYVAATGTTMVVEQYSVNLGITAWEVDLFGRIRSLKEQALQEYLSTEQARRGAQTSLISEVARVYLALAADRENFKLAQSTLEAQESGYGMVRLRYDNGLVTELDLRRAQTQVDTAKGDIARYTQLVAQDQNALNLLVGTPVPEDLLPADLGSVKPPADISPGLSSEVLLRRPDILEAEHQLKAAYAFIGAARAAFFPRISLTTAIGTASSELSGLFKAGSNTWSFAPQATMPIFDARTWTAYKVSKSTREIALTQYEKTIQTAFREVADVLAVRGTVDQQVASQESILDSAKKIYELSDQRYSQGIDSYLSVLDAQRSLYAAQQALTFLRLAKQVNQVKIFTVLGGDAEP